MTYAAFLTREDFIGWLGTSYVPKPRELSDVQSARSAQTGAVLLIWNLLPEPATPDFSQPVIAVPAREMREFFAFANTYISTYEPFSAFFRVVPLEDVPELFSDGSGRRKKLPNGLMGTVIAEARLQTGTGNSRPADLSIQACLATMSSVAVSMLSAGLSGDQVQSTLGRWLKIRSRITEERLRVDPARICDFWDIVASAYESVSVRDRDETGDRIATFVGQVVDSDANSVPKAWEALVEGLSKAKSALDHMQLSREDRVRAMDEVMAAVVSAERVDTRTREVVLGYLASRVADGSLAYLPLLDPAEQSLSMASLWFGLFTSLRNDSDVLITGECLGRRVARKIAAKSSIFEVPDADISFDEFETLASGKQSNLKLRTEHKSVIVVELAPAVKAVFGLPPSARQIPEARSVAIAPEYAREIKYLLGRLSAVVDDMSGTQQRELFSDKPSSKGAASARRKRTTR